MRKFGDSATLATFAQATHTGYLKDPLGLSKKSVKLTDPDNLPTGLVFPTPAKHERSSNTGCIGTPNGTCPSKDINLKYIMTNP